VKSLLKVTASSGQFRNEYAVKGKNHKGDEFSLFVSRRHVKLVDEFVNDESPALLSVERITQQGDLVLIRLPGQTFGNGSTITVREGDLCECQLEPA
jgi:hypothetical protein